MLAVDAEAGSSLCPHFNWTRDPKGQLLLDGTMGRIGRMGRMIMGQGDKGTVLWGTRGLWDSITHHASLDYLH